MREIITIELEGHIIDSLILPKVMDTILDNGANYEIVDIKIGKEKTQSSYAKMNISADSSEVLNAVVEMVTNQGATLVKDESVKLAEAPKDKTLPDDFYSTTNLATDILLNGQWIKTIDTAMDAAIVVDEVAKTGKCTKLSQIKKGDKVVMGFKGVKVHPLRKEKEKSIFSFMGSEVSSEKPKSLIIKKIAKRMKEIKANNEGSIIFVLGPAVVHTKSQHAFSQLIEKGYVDHLFAGNALATHDIEAALFGTSLGICMNEGTPISGGHSHHLRAINKINQCGSIKTAVDTGILTSGIMYTLVKNDVDYVLAGSIRDDGPLPEVITDSVVAQCEMRKRLKSAKMVVMVASMLHSIAVGNLLPASVETICVDINPAVVTKLADRGSFQTIGLVTDTESFMSSLAGSLEE